MVEKKTSGGQQPPAVDQSSASGKAIAKVTSFNAERVGRRLTIDEMQSDVLLQAHAIWLEACRGRLFPSREDMGPRMLAPFLRNVTLFQILDEGQDFEYRVMGDAAVVAWGQSFQGMRRADLNGLEAGMGDIVCRLCRSVARQRAPIFMRGVLQKEMLDACNQETLFLPLGITDGAVDHLLSIGVYLPRSVDELLSVLDEKDHDSAGR
jgi:hypothetical protein